MVNRRGIFLAILLLSLVSVSASDEGRDEWVGLWHFIQKTRERPMHFYLSVSVGTKRPVLYGESWNVLILADYKITPDEIFFNQRVKGFNVAFQGKRDQEQVNGIWQLIHPQYSEKNTFTGSKVSAALNWEPLKALDSIAGIRRLIDLNGHLKQRMSNLDDFDGVWKEFYSDFYVFLRHAPAPESARRTIENADFAARSENAVKSVSRFLAELSQSFPDFQLAEAVVLTPFAGRKPKLISFGERVFVVVNGLELGKTTDAISYSHFTREILSSVLETRLTLAPGRAFDYFRQGVPLYVTAKLASSNLSNLLGDSTPTIELLEKGLSECKARVRKGEEISEAERRYLSHQFASSLSQRYTLSQFPRLNSPAIQAAFDSFLAD